MCLQLLLAIIFIIIIMIIVIIIILITRTIIVIADGRVVDDHVGRELLLKLLCIVLSYVCSIMMYVFSCYDAVYVHCVCLHWARAPRAASAPSGPGPSATPC